MDKVFEKERERDEITWKNTDAQGRSLVIRVHHRGRWKLDNELGKATLVIEIHDKSGDYLTYAPTHEDIDMMLDQMLRVELENDLYKFKNGGRRPPSMFFKLKRTEEVLNYWKGERVRRIKHEKP